jgi:hypothetical protein
MDNWPAIVTITSELRAQCRLKAVGEELPEYWGVLFIPTSGYLEGGGTGPVPFREIEWVDVQTSVIERRGRLIPDLVHDVSERLALAFNAAGIHFTEHQTCFRIRRVEPWIAR